MIDNFYVTVRDGHRTGFLLGPYATHDEALQNVDRGRKMAHESDNYGRSWFYAYGTSRVTDLQPKYVFGV